MYVAYPSCHTVAAVDAATGKVVAHIDYDASGALTVVRDGTLSCPMECTAEKVAPAPVGTGPRPVALSLEPTTRRLAIGAEGLASVAVVDLDASFLPTTFVQVPLEHKMNDGLGISALALSPVIGMGGNRDGELDDTQTPGGQGQYVYAVATDTTVRVADVLNAPARECDTQIDGRFLRTISDIQRLQCLPINDPTLPRRPDAKGPGIELIGDAVPLSVAFFTVDRITDVDLNPVPRPKSNFAAQQTTLDDPRTVLVGHFAIVTATNGFSYVVNVDDDDVFDKNSVTADRFNANDPIGTQGILVIPHQLRDGGRYRGATETPATSTTTTLADDRGQEAPACSDVGPAAEIAGPRATTEPVRNLNAGPIATNKAGELPSLRSVTCVDTPDAMGATKVPATVPVSELLFSAPVQTRTEVFPDLRSVRIDEQWSIAWEGALSLDSGLTAVDGPIVRTGRTKVDATGLHLIDPSKPFCDIGVEPFDYVQLRGCNPTSSLDCPIGYQCFLHPESQLGMGACLLSNEAQRLANLCRDFLISGRRYTVNSDPHSGDLVLLPRKHVLRTTPIDGCVDDKQCTLLANYAAQLRTDKDPTASPVVKPDDSDGTLKDVSGHQWQCRADDARPAVNTDPARNRRCVQVCATNDDCNVEDDELNRRFNIAQFKMVCQSGVCMEGIAPPQQCINGPQHYDVHPSEAFAVIGSRSGYVHPITQQGDRCVRDPSPSTTQIGRIPLKAPPCDPTADPVTGQLPGGGFEPNPCSKTATQSELQPMFAPAPASCATTTDAKTPAVERQAPAIQFRNRSMKLTLVDPYYPGDSQCILDRGGQLGNIPLVYQGYQIAFHQVAGFTPMILNAILPSFPVKVVQGPTQSIWILDEGDFLSTVLGVASTRGKVWRVESINTATYSLLQ
jgi:hypothetical protein